MRSCLVTVYTVEVFYEDARDTIGLYRTRASAEKARDEAVQVYGDIAGYRYTDIFETLLRD